MIALAAVFVLPVVGTALGLPLGEWLAVLSGERSLPDFWLRGERSHFERKPREPKPGSSLDLVRGEGFAEDIPPPAPAAPEPAPAAPVPEAAPAAAPEPPPERTFAQEPEQPQTRRPPRLRRVRMGNGIQSWYKGEEGEQTQTKAYIAAEPPPQAAPKPQAQPAQATPPAAPVEVAKKETPPPAPPREPEKPKGRPVPGRTGPVTGAAPAPSGTVGPAAAAPTIDAPLPPPPAGESAPPPNVDGPYPCVVERTKPERKVRVEQTDSRYPVSGNTVAELKASVAAAVGPGRGPGRSDGHAEPSCSFKQEGPLCTPLCSVVVSIKRLLPDGAARVPPELGPRWRRFAERVEAHESAHVHLYVLEGNEMLKRLNELPRSECKNIQKVVAVEAAVAREQSKQRHTSYDATCKADPSCALEL